MGALEKPGRHRQRLSAMKESAGACSRTGEGPGGQEFAWAPHGADGVDVVAHPDKRQRGQEEAGRDAAQGTEVCVVCQI